MPDNTDNPGQTGAGENQQQTQTQETQQQQQDSNSEANKGTIMNGGDGQGGEQQQQAPANWPENWRDLSAGGDEKLRKRLDRFASPGDIVKSWLAAEQKITSGEYKKPAALPENASPEQIAEYRKELGVPDKPDGYDTTLPDGLVIGDADKPLVAEFLKEMHGVNAPPAMVKSALSAYYKIQENQIAAQEAHDDEVWKRTEDALRAEFGSEYRRNQNIINNYMSSLPEALRDNLIGARLGDGSKLLGNEQGVRFLLGLALEANPVATVIPNTSNPAKSIEDEIASLKVGSDEYWKSPDKQARYRQLVDAQEKLKKKA